LQASKNKQKTTSTMGQLLQKDRKKYSQFFWAETSSSSNFGVLTNRWEEKACLNDRILPNFFSPAAAN